MSNKRNKKHSHAQPHQGNTQDNSNDSDVRVHGAIEVHPSPSLIQQHDSDRSDDKTQQNKSYTISVLTLIGLAIYSFLTLVLVVISGWQLKVSRDTFNASNRPYIGINASNMKHYVKNEDGEMVESPRAGLPTIKTEAMSFTIELKNFGPVPGTNYRDSYRAFFNGIEMPVASIPNAHRSILFPTEVVWFTGSIKGQTYTDIMSGKVALMLEIIIAYDGPHGHTDYCDRRQYKPDVNGFFDLGDCK